MCKRVQNGVIFAPTSRSVRPAFQEPEPQNVKCSHIKLRRTCRDMAASVPVVEALEEVRRMRGGTQSHLMRCSDGGYYVVKFQNNLQGKKTLVNELLASRIARLMNLPIPEFSIVSVSPDLIRYTEDLVVELRHSRIPCQPGLCFGSRHVGDCGSEFSSWRVRDVIPECEFSLIENRNAFAGMLVFDQWTCNIDGRQTVFLRDLERHRLSVYMIDNGLCFGGENWEFDQAPLRGVYREKTIYDFIKTFDDFEHWLSYVDRFDLACLQGLASSVPTEWIDGDYKSLDKLVCTLDLRRKRMRELLWLTLKSAPDAFHNFRGEYALQSDHS